MDNQRKRAKGGRELSKEDAEFSSQIKAHGDALLALVNKMREAPGADLRWISIGATDLQRGFMALNRAIEKPEGF